MALIQKIRSKSGLVLFLMVLAIVSFIAMLITQDSNRSLSNFSGSNTTTVAKVAGKELEYQKMEQVAEDMYGNRGGDNQVRNTIFSQFVENALVTSEADKIGLGVCRDELLDLEFGPMPSQVIMSNQALMQNPEQLQQIKQAIQANTMPVQGKRYWAEIETQVIKDRLQNKMNNLVAKAIYTPTWLVEEGYKDLTQPVDFEYVRVPFDRVEDKDAPVTDADYEAYLKENKARFTTEEETRTIEYVVVDAIASPADSAQMYAKIADLKEGFRTTDKDSSYALSKGGALNPQYLTAEAVGPILKDSIFNKPIGTVVGPYVENKAYWLAKLIDRRSAPDSVNSRHILVQGAGAQKTADSLKAILDVNPGLWDSLNMKFSGDATAKVMGGNLEFQPQGKFVPEFNDLIFYKAQQGKFYTVASQFGVHIVQVLGVKTGKNESRIKIAIIRELIIPSSVTDRKASMMADELMTSSKNLEDLRKNAQAKGLPIVPTPIFRVNDASVGNFGTSEGVRGIIRWAFESKVGERCKTAFALRDQGDAYNNKYVIAALKSIVPKGDPSVKDLKEQLTPMVKNRKKGEVLKAKITSSDMSAVAAQFNSKIDTAKGVTFNATFVPNLGSEAKVIGSIFTLEAGQTTKAILGETGVFLEIGRAHV